MKSNKINSPFIYKAQGSMVIHLFKVKLIIAIIFYLAHKSYTILGLNGRVHNHDFCSIATRPVARPALIFHTVYYYPDGCKNLF